MPTFKNETEHYIDYEGLVHVSGGGTRKSLFRFEPGEERGFPFWLPYQKLGLTLISADYPVVPNKILVSGTFIFVPNSERKFTIEPCQRYVVSIIAQKGEIKFYSGSSPTAQIISEEANFPYRYGSVFEWANAPFVKLVCEDKEAEVSLNIEVFSTQSDSGDEVTWR